MSGFFKTQKGKINPKVEICTFCNKPKPCEHDKPPVKENSDVPAKG